MLGGLAAVAIPIIIQILTRKNVRRINWGAWLFLDKTMKKRRRKVLLAVSCLLVWAGSLLGFGEVISVVYPIFGYISIAFLVFMVIHFLRAKRAERNSTV